MPRAGKPRRGQFPGETGAVRPAPAPGFPRETREAARTEPNPSRELPRIRFPGETGRRAGPASPRVRVAAPIDRATAVLLDRGRAPGREPQTKRREEDPVSWFPGETRRPSSTPAGAAAPSFHRLRLPWRSLIRGRGGTPVSRGNRRPVGSDRPSLILEFERRAWRAAEARAVGSLDDGRGPESKRHREVPAGRFPGETGRSCRAGCRAEGCDSGVGFPRETGSRGRGGGPANVGRRSTSGGMSAPAAREAHARSTAGSNPSTERASVRATITKSGSRREATATRTSATRTSTPTAAFPSGARSASAGPGPPCAARQRRPPPAAGRYARR